MTTPALEQINAALATVNDPEIRRPITDLGMVESVDVDDRGGVSVTVLLTVAGCPLKDTITRDVTAAVEKVPGVTGVSLTLGVMSPDQRSGLQEKAWPIETFFHKVVMLRNRLRVLEQQINGAEIPDALKVQLQGYISGCYGTLTSFNVLFEEEEDRFRGSAKGGE